ncbi:MAG: class I tRNA ligase family protein, partial [Anaerolineales bacterium]
LRVGTPKALGDGHTMGETGLKAAAHAIRYLLGQPSVGLPVEIGVERKLGFTNKAQIEEYGIADFNKLCRRSAFDYIQDWERLTDRIGFWVSLEDAYVTFTNEYIESVWW